MLTYSSALSTLQSLTGVLSTDTTNSALLIQFWNQSRQTVAGIRGGNWPYLEVERTALTTEDQDFVYVPNDMRRVTAVRVEVGSGDSATLYLPQLIFDEQRWQQILAMRLGTNQYPYFVFQRGQKLLLNPTSSVTDTPVILLGRRTVKDINIADVTTATVTDTAYSTTFTAVVASGATSATLSGAWALTTGEWKVTFSNDEVRIVTFTNGATTATWEDALTSGATATIGVTTTGGGSILTMATTAMTADFVGRYIRITQTSAAGGGDGEWYEIGAYYSSTLISLVKEYQGTELSGATAACTIGFITYEPEAWQMAPIYRSLALYWDFKENMVLSERYWMLYDGGQEIGKRETPAGMIGQMLEEAGETFDGHYIAPQNRGWGNWPGDYWYPWQQGTGFN